MDEKASRNNLRLTDQAIENLVAQLLSEHVPQAGFQGVNVTSDIDFDGEPIIRVAARFRRRPPGKPDVLINSVHAIREALIAHGDDRFVFLTNQVEDERRPELDIEEEVG